MRREPTEPEKRLWRHRSNSQLGGFKFRRQAAIPPFIVDFFCPAKGLIVEVDGETHFEAADVRRDAALTCRGFTTIRFTNADVMSNIDGVLTAILQELEYLPDRWSGSPVSPTPTQHRVNSAPHCSGHAGGMAGPMLLKGRG
jgi:very-short-patch-repair endonuclease